MNRILITSRILRGYGKCSQSLSTTSRIGNLNENLADADKEVDDIIKKEKNRQRESVVLIPSENFTSRAVLDALGTVMQNKYSEGYPGARYYGGNCFIDQIELLCQQRALEAFHLDPNLWGVNVQPLSGSPCNLYVYYALLKLHDRIMSLDLPHGGHLSHGYQTSSKKISAISSYFEVLPYRLDEKTGLIDYDMLEKTSALYRPKLLLAGASAYCRHIDYARFRKMADSVNAYFMVDMAHIAGLVAAQVMPSPFDFADVVTTTTHKSLRGPRGAMIFYRKGVRNMGQQKEEISYDIEQAINASVFPGHQGGPHNHTIAALAVALKQAQTPWFKKYQQQVLLNSAQLAKRLKEKGYSLVSGGTDNHMMLLDLREKKIDGARVEAVLELVNIAANKNTVPGDKSAMVPGGLRMGSPAMTTRGLLEADFDKIAEYVHQAIQLTIRLHEQNSGLKMKDFKRYLNEEGYRQYEQLAGLKEEVNDFAKKFPVIGQ